MSDQGTQTVTIEVQGGDEPIHGEVLAEGHRAVAFEGWVELHWAIRRVLETEVADTRLRPGGLK